MRPITKQDLADIRDHFPLDDCLRAPEIPLTPETLRSFETLYLSALESGPGALITYSLETPKFAFLDYLASHYSLLLHGSPQKGLAALDPVRHSRDARPFGDQQAIYATQDSLWAMFYAVLDRQRFRGGISTAAIHLQEAGGVPARYYYFCMEAASLAIKPWTEGAIYLLSSEGFEPDPDMQGISFGERELVCTHWMRLSPVEPLARLLVSPSDFPFLDRLWGYDPLVLDRRMSAGSLAGYPFLSDEEVYPVRPG